MIDRAVFIALLIGFGSVDLLKSEILAQTKTGNPLMIEISQQDPTIPVGYGARELTSFEQYRIKQEITKLNQIAQEELKQGNPNAAFKQWYRYLKLSRVIDPELEIEHLGNVGAIAWQENRGLDVRNIAERLTNLQTKLTANSPLSADVLDKLAIAYQQVRYVDKVIVIYQQILTNNQQADNLVAVQKNLETLGELYLSRFDYDNAAHLYEQLLALSSQESKQSKQTNYLNTLSDIYDRTNKTQRAIAIKKRLVKQYTLNKQPLKIPALTMAIARDYETLSQPNKAIAAYRQTWQTAYKTQQFALASDALTRLGKIYQQNRQHEQAIATYNKLLMLQQQSYNHYGLINTYDKLGKIHLQLNQRKQAQQNFQQGLELATSLNYRVKYFQQRIEAIN